MRRGHRSRVRALACRVANKKRRHELLAVRAGRPVTQTTPSAEDGGTTVLITGINTRYYRFTGKEIQKSKFSVDFFMRPGRGFRSPMAVCVRRNDRNHGFDDNIFGFRSIDRRFRNRQDNSGVAQGQRHCGCLRPGGRSGSRLVLSESAYTPPERGIGAHGYQFRYFGVGQD